MMIEIVTNYTVLHCECLLLFCFCTRKLCCGLVTLLFQLQIY